MNHQTYEEWALMPEYLSPEEKQALELHMEECESCKQLAESWAKIETFLLDVKPVEPTAGFTARFAANLVDRKAKEHKKQVRKFLIVLSIILIVAMSTVSIFYYTSNSPIGIIEGVFKTGAQMLTLWESAKTIVSSVTNLAPVGLVLPVLAIGSIVITGMTSVWLATIWKFTLAGGKVR